MSCDGVADLFSGIFLVIFADYGEKSAVCVLVVVLLAIDEGKSLSVIFHDSIGIFTALDHTQKKLLVGVITVKKRSTLMDWGESMTATR